MFFGISLDDQAFKWLEIGGSWFSAIATFAAVFVSLYLARQQSKIRLRINFTSKSFPDRGGNPLPVYLVISVVNCGYRPVTISDVALRFGIIKRRYAPQHFQPTSWSTQIPIRVEHGEEINLSINLGNESDWAKNLIDSIGPIGLSDLIGLKLLVSTTVGTTVLLTPSIAIRKLIFERFLSLR